MKSLAPSQDLVALASAAQLAGREIMRIYSGTITVSAKADASPVTEADQRAEGIILQELARSHPDIAVVAEEQAAAGVVPVVGQRFFLVDPLDGTREFISRNGEFTVNIALVENAVPVMGVVYAPALSAIYCGEGDRAFAATLPPDAEMTAVQWRSIRVAAGPATIAVASRSHRDAETDAFLESHNITATRAAGSSLKFCLVAEGSAHVYPRFGRTMEWDTAAGHAVLKAAGGHVRTVDASPLRYGKAGFANPAFIASSA